MEEGRLHTITDLVEVAGQLPPSAAALAGGSRVEDLRLVESARDHGMLNRIILVGQAERIAKAVDEVGIEVPAEDIIAVSDDEEAAAATVALAKAGEVDMVLKGTVSTPLLHRHMLPLANRPTFSLVSIFDAAPLADGRPMVLTDAGVTTNCTFGRMTGLIQNAVEVAQCVMGIPRPKVAVLSANEKKLPSLTSSWLAAQLSERDWGDADVYGPLSLDLAIDPRSVAVKGLPGAAGAKAVAGKADVLVCPNIDAANVLYKMVSAMIKYGQASLANFIVGFPLSYVLLSRADALETRLNSVALGSVYAQRVRAREEGGSEGVGAGRADAGGGGVLAPGVEAVACRAAEEIGRPLEGINLVVVHLNDGERGGEATIAAVKRGAIAESSTVVLGGLNAAAVEGVAGRVAKGIGAMFVAAGCDVEAIALAGSPLQDRALRKAVQERVRPLAPVVVYS